MRGDPREAGAGTLDPPILYLHVAASPPIHGRIHRALPARRRPQAPSGAGWLHEIKLDGFRLMALRRGVGGRLNGNDWTDCYRLVWPTSAPVGHAGDPRQTCSPVFCYDRRGRRSFLEHIR